MSAPKSVDVWKLTQLLKNLRADTAIPTDYKAQVQAINRVLKNDQTGIVTTVVDFMNNSANVPMKIETQNENLDKALETWQNSILNKDIGLAVPRGLRELSTQYYTERWKSSFIVLNIKWENVSLPEAKNILMPTKMWFADGGNVSVKGDSNDITKREYFIGNSKQPLKETPTKSIVIRKPYNSWYELTPTPYLVKRGVLFNALLKSAIVTKQSDVIQSIIPYILSLKTGSDKLAELGMLADEEGLKELKDQFMKAKEQSDYTGSLGDYIGTFSHDVNIEHLIPDLTKILSADNTEAVDKNLLAGLGLVEMEGFSKSRQETILNPKMLVEEVKDSVLDWASLIEEVVLQMKEKNLRKHPKLFNNEMKVIPGKVKTFVTEDLRQMTRSLYDRGIISKETVLEETLDFDFDFEVEKRKRETEQGLNETMYPPVTQNQEQHLNENEDLEDQNKKPGTPEVDEFDQAILNAIKEAVEETK